MHKLTSLFKRFRIPETSISIQKLTFYLTAWFAGAYNMPFFVNIWGLLGHKSITLIMLYAVIICCLLLLNFLMLNILSFKHVFKPSIIVLFLISTTLLYSNLNGKQYNPFAFNFNEWLAGSGRFLSVNFAIALIFLFVVPSALLFRTHINWGTAKISLVRVTTSIVLTSLMLISFYQVTEHKVQPIYEAMRVSLSDAIPMHFIDSSLKFIEYQYFNPIHSFSVLDKEPTISPKTRHKTLVLIIGESIRADIFNQYLASIHTNNQAQNITITSCNTYSGSSVQCIFSFLPADKFNETKANHQQNVIDLLSLSGVNLYWLTHHKGCGTLCVRANVHEVSLECMEKKCNDLELVDSLLAETLRSINPKQSNLIVIQTKNIASPLYSRFYPKEYSQQVPECNTILLTSCSDNQLTNSYNNAMLYVSVMLDHAVNHLEQFKQKNENVDTALLFTSNYGESLGEHGYYFHGSPRSIAPIEQVLVPLLIIDENLPTNCLSAMQKKFSHDVIAHTLLGQFHIKTKAYQAELDVQAACSGLISNNFIVDHGQSSGITTL